MKTFDEAFEEVRDLIKSADTDEHSFEGNFCRCNEIQSNEKAWQVIENISVEILIEPINCMEWVAKAMEVGINIGIRMEKSDANYPKID